MVVVYVFSFSGRYMLILQEILQAEDWRSPSTKTVTGARFSWECQSSQSSPIRSSFPGLFNENDQVQLARWHSQPNQMPEEGAQQDQGPGWFIGLSHNYRQLTHNYIRRLAILIPTWGTTHLRSSWYSYTGNSLRCVQNGGIHVDHFDGNIYEMMIYHWSFGYICFEKKHLSWCYTMHLSGKCPSQKWSNKSSECAAQESWCSCKVPIWCICMVHLQNIHVCLLFTPTGLPYGFVWK